MTGVIPPPLNLSRYWKPMQSVRDRAGGLGMSKSGGVFKFFGGRMTSRGQCRRGGCVCLRMSKSGGVFQFFGGRMTSRRQCPRRGGGAFECLLYIVFHPSKFRPPPPTWMAGYGPAPIPVPWCRSIVQVSGVPRGGGQGGHGPRAQALEGAPGQLVGANFKSRGEFQPSKSSIYAMGPALPMH